VSDTLASATRSGGNARSLDLLRSFAIVSVVVAHATLAFGAPAALAPLQFGGTGVDLFFVLSGWLLGRQLVLELRATRRIDLVHFWSRRWMRTLPAYYAVLLFTFAEQVIVNHNRDLRWSYLFFGQTYLTSLPYFFVSWSLCVEEHFYLLVAPLLLLAFRLKRWGIPLMGLMLVMPVACRQLGWYHALEQTHVRFDECLTGVGLAAISVFAPTLWHRLCAAAPALATAGAAVYAWLIWVRWHPQHGIWPDEQTACAFIFGSLLLFAVSTQQIRQRFYVPGAGFLAKRAYAVYLLHAESLALLRRLHPQSFLLFLMLTWICTLVIAECLYRLVELPVMNARESFGFSRSRRTLAPSPPERGRAAALKGSV
jgi:peptidoglycan/LPS O-acetylase OafA/YrhL